jgi:membrane complex biogenesis BtpA family protein
VTGPREISGLIGMVHLGPLPGAARPAPLEATIEAAREDASVLEAAGFDALMVENFGDAPFFADDVPKITVAAMTRIVSTLAAERSIPVGVNVLRNDAAAGLAVATSSGATFIRVNVLSGAMWTDQGLITGRAAELARLRAALHAEVAVLADVMVKHATPPPGLTIALAAADLWERGGADGIVVSGTGTGSPTPLEDLEAVAAAVPDAPLYAGSGVTAETVAATLERCAGVIVGTATKIEGIAANPVDATRARAIVEAAR